MRVSGVVFNGAVTSSVNSSEFKVADFENVLVVIEAQARTGSVSVVAQLQYSVDDVNWYNSLAAATSAITGASSTAIQAGKVASEVPGILARVALTVTGSGSIPMAITIVAK